MANFFNDLKRRSVFRVGAAYLVIAWLVLQLTDLVFENMNAPDWVMQSIMLLLAVGFPIALVLAWAFEIKPDGVHSDAPGSSKNSRLFFSFIGIILIAAVGVFLWQQSITTTDVESSGQSATDNVDVESDDESLLAIAVLPFESFTEDREDQFFADGLADTLLHKLAQLRTLTVIARNSSFQFKGQNVDVREIGEILGVPTVVEGSVQRQGGQIRIIAQLVSTKDGAHLWSGTFDGTFDNIFELQDDVAAAIAEQLQVTLSDHDRERLYRRGTSVPEAYEMLARARASKADFNSAGFDPDNNPRILQLQKTIELDPNYALAWADLSGYYNGLAFMDTDSERFDEFVAQSLDAARTAIEVDPNESDGYVMLGFAHWRTQELAEAEEAYRKALAIDPNHAGALGGLGLALYLSSPEEAYSVFLRSQEIDPSNVVVYRQLFFTLRALGRLEEGVAQLRKGIGLAPNFFLLYTDLADLHSGSFGRYDMAAKVLSDLLRRDPNSRAALSSMAENWFAVNDLQRAKAWNDELLRKQPNDSDAKDLQVRLLHVQGDSATALSVASTLPAQGFLSIRRDTRMLPVCVALDDSECANERLASMLQFLAAFEQRSGQSMRGFEAFTKLLSGKLLYPDEASARVSLQAATETFEKFSLFSAGSMDIDSRRYFVAEALALQGQNEEAIDELLAGLVVADGGFVKLASDGLPPESSWILPMLRDHPGYDEWLTQFTSRRTAMREKMIAMEAAGEIAETP